MARPERYRHSNIWTSDPGNAWHHRRMDATDIRVDLVDDLRSFVDGRRADVARTNAAGADLLNRHRDQRLDELWLDHDLGADDTI